MLLAYILIGFFHVGNYISFCHFAAVDINMFENVKADNSLNICAIKAEIICLRHIHKFLLSYQEFGLNLALQLFHKKSFCKGTSFSFYNIHVMLQKEIFYRNYLK
jgi:hypothetical protein